MKPFCGQMLTMIGMTVISVGCWMIHPGLGLIVGGGLIGCAGAILYRDAVIRKGQGG